jgi:hypothetical protein
MPHVPGHVVNQPPSGYQQVFEDGRYRQVLPSDKPSARKSNASFINQLTNLFKKSLQSQVKTNNNLFDAFRIADQELDDLTLPDFMKAMPGGQGTFGMPYLDREPVLKDSLRSILDKILQDTSNVSPFYSGLDDLAQKVMEGLQMQGQGLQMQGQAMNPLNPMSNAQQPTINLGQTYTAPTQPNTFAPPPTPPQGLPPNVLDRHPRPHTFPTIKPHQRIIPKKQINRMPTSAQQSYTPGM